MRVRTGNPHAEAHGRDLRVFDWIAPAGTDPHDAAVKAEAALGCKLYHRGDGEQHGYVNTSRLPDGSLHVCVVLYEACADPNCVAGHTGVVHKRIPDPPAGKLQAMTKAVGEHPTHKLTGDDETDAALLRSLGFPDDHPVMPEGVRQAGLEAQRAEIEELTFPMADTPDG